MTQYLRLRLARSSIRMLACTFKPTVMKELCDEFRCVACFKSADDRRKEEDSFVYIYVNIGTALAPLAIYGGVVTMEGLRSAYPLMAGALAPEEVSASVL